MAKSETPKEKALHQELIDQMVTLATSGFGLVAALAWNEAVQAFVKDYLERYFPESAIWGKFIYALVITSLAVLITYYLSRLATTMQRSGDEKKS